MVRDVGKYWVMYYVVTCDSVMYSCIVFVLNNGVMYDENYRWFNI